jgi:hypothetical protein
MNNHIKEFIMDNKRNLKNINCSIILMIFAFAFLGFISNPQPCSADISPDSYCQLVIQVMQKEISNIQELTALANQYKDDPEVLAQQEEIKRAAFDQAKSTLFSSFETTAEEYVTYMGKNGQAVNAYLEENQDIKQQIDSLSDQIKSLMADYETLKESIINSEPPLP